MAKKQLLTTSATHVTVGERPRHVGIFKSRHKNRDEKAAYGKHGHPATLSEKGLEWTGQSNCASSATTNCFWRNGQWHGNQVNGTHLMTAERS